MKTRAVDLATGTGVWHDPGLPVIPLRRVLVRDPERRVDPRGLLSTDTALTAEAVVGHYVRRRPVAVAAAKVVRPVTDAHALLGS